MNFASDNAYGACPEILEAVVRSADGSQPSYGEDASSIRLRARLSEIFEREVDVFPVITGTAANSLALATLCPPHGAIFCHEEAHIATDECAAPEFFTHGAKVVGIPGADGKLTQADLASVLPHFSRGVHSSKPSVVSITQLSELGTAYSAGQVAQISAFCRKHGLFLHMDGARFANALVGQKVSPAALSWRSGVDVLSFGATKNGALSAECVIFFDRALGRDFEFRRKKSGHLISKMRFVSAQLEAYLADDLWLKSAARANQLAANMARALVQLPGARLAHPVEGNQIFLFLPDRTVAHLRANRAKFYDWQTSRDGHTLIRLVTSFATPEIAVQQFVELARSA